MVVEQVLRHNFVLESPNFVPCRGEIFCLQMFRCLLMSNGKAAKRLSSLANSFKVSLRPLCSGMTRLLNI